ncbi:hypothetical protein D3C83_46210 [compost metagenome]
MAEETDRFVPLLLLLKDQAKTDQSVGIARFKRQDALEPFPGLRERIGIERDYTEIEQGI